MGGAVLTSPLRRPAAHPEWEPATHASREPGRPGMGDRLYRNDGGHFVDVSERAGLHGGATRYGLGVVASDLNGDGCPDLYIANDFQEDDFLKIVGDVEVGAAVPVQIARDHEIGRAHV